MISSSVEIAAAGAVCAIVGGVALFIPTVGSALAILVAVLFGIGTFFYPVVKALDVGDRLPEIQSARKSDPVLKKIDVRHQYFWAIVVINLLFEATFVGWVVAFVMAHTPCDADVPDEVAAKAGI